MRKIEEKMIQAIRNKEYFKLSNTQIIRTDYSIQVYLHGNKIADIYNNKIVLSSCRWRTVTTKSRLNAILSMYGFHIYQKDFTWFIHSADNSCSDITFYDITFYDGIIIAI